MLERPSGRCLFPHWEDPHSPGRPWKTALKSVQATLVDMLFQQSRQHVFFMFWIERACQNVEEKNIGAVKGWVGGAAEGQMQMWDGTFCALRTYGSGPVEPFVEIKYLADRAFQSVLKTVFGVQKGGETRGPARDKERKSANMRLCVSSPAPATSTWLDNYTTKWSMPNRVENKYWDTKRLRRERTWKQRMCKNEENSHYLMIIAPASAPCLIINIPPLAHPQMVLKLCLWKQNVPKGKEHCTEKTEKCRKHTLIVNCGP